MTRIAIALLAITRVACAATGMDPRAALVAEATARHPQGAAIFLEQCASCHGKLGEGVADKYDEALYGERSLDSLTRLIDRTMPEDAPERCTGDQAAAVAAWVYDAFYSPAARDRIHPPRLAFQHLTGEQFRLSVAALTASFSDPWEDSGATGLRAVLYNDRDTRDDRKILERIDPKVHVDFGEGSPIPDKIKPEAFAISWRGGIRIPESGTWGFRLVTTNGARLWINAPDVSRDRRGGPPLIDAWVSSGNAERSPEARLTLPGGHVFPLRLEFFKFREKVARIRLQWQPPHQTWEDIPPEALTPSSRPHITALQTAFPPDDASAGYPRGTLVSPEWHAAVNEASLEAAADLADHAEKWARAGDGPDKPKRLAAFLRTLAERAWRRPLADAEAARLASVLEAAPDAATGLRRAALAVLQSPAFLYPSLPAPTPAPDHAAAAAMALALWDALPDARLREATASGSLRQPSQLAAEAARMVRTPAARARFRAFVGDWLAMDEADEIDKDRKAWPDFTAETVSALRHSLTLFVDKIVWEGSGDWRELLAADYLWLNGPLAALYDAPRVPEGTDRFERITFPESERAGILTHPYLLAVHAYHRSSSPIHRGVFLTRDVMGRFLKPPPMAIAFMDGRFQPHLTMRQKVTELTRDESCMGCHATINPLGFALEHFDAVGRHRFLDNAAPVDAVSDYVTADGDSIRLSGPRDLARHAIGSRDAQLGFIRRLFQFMVRQPPGAFGSDTLARLHADFVASHYRIPELLAAIAAVPARHALAPADS